MAGLAVGKLPPGKVLIPGVVTHHTTSVEHPRLVADRIVRFAGLVGRENVIAGTDCGFAQLEAYQRVHPQVMWAKLQALAEGAQVASQELWGVRESPAVRAKRLKSICFRLRIIDGVGDLEIVE